jgi:hypothetical protein
MHEHTSYVVHVGGESVLLSRPPAPLSYPEASGFLLLGGGGSAVMHCRGLWLCAVWVCARFAR